MEINITEIAETLKKISKCKDEQTFNLHVDILFEESPPSIHLSIALILLLNRITDEKHKSIFLKNYHYNCSINDLISDFSTGYIDKYYIQSNYDKLCRKIDDLNKSVMREYYKINYDYFRRMFIVTCRKEIEHAIAFSWH